MLSRSSSVRSLRYCVPREGICVEPDGPRGPAVYYAVDFPDEGFRHRIDLPDRHWAGANLPSSAP
jgi:hypothetical protein